ncbi:NEL-type E3 ubiquitin ligase domain-containing protein [Pseudomonas fluorescens]|uniref:NEL-type E3 ubiquitin ligase domain-containing protein n=1 Tax=Pseudomonas fluorescens TaxID=294 RepID=UPI0007D0AAC1|nr:NEL-type E3 ubiquitin ligase domain-containing protein [Pseudomonas fluorescens]
MSVSTPPTPDEFKGRHYPLIKHSLDKTFTRASLDRAVALAATPLKIDPWYAMATARQHDKLQAANLKTWASQGKVDRLLGNAADLQKFAAPLLQARLKERFGVEHDVNTTYLRLYLPKTLPWYALDVTGGSTTRTVSLLQAALHNFAQTERVDADSQYITEPDKEDGRFDVIALKDTMPIDQFQALCRELDIGAQYQRHLANYLLPGEPLAAAVLQTEVIQSQQDALAFAAEMALLKGDIQYDAYKLVLDLLAGKTPLLLNQRREMHCCELSMLEKRLTGIVLLIPAKLDKRGIRRVIVYVPHDPDHPLKEYASPAEFIDELARQLREDKVSASAEQSYRQFFAQFVDQQDRGHFFAELEQRLYKTTWHEKSERSDQRPTWRKEPVATPNLQFRQVYLGPDVWQQVYQNKLNKILNDARQIAVSTADTDALARWAWWDNFKQIVSDIFNAALLIATPFVPGLGELMMAYTAYQLTSDVIEGVVDLAEGLASEAAAHVLSVVTDIIQLATFQAGSELGALLRPKLSALVDGMQPVRLADGKTRLWHPDLSPYEQNTLALPSASKPDHHGLHQHAEKTLLPLEGKLYHLEKPADVTLSTTHRIKHPRRPTAYSPKIEHNGHGAWVHEGENPLEWDSPTLMRRLGHRVARFSATEREQIRISSGTADDALRHMYSANAEPPPLLSDAIKRFSAYDDVQAAGANIRDGLPIDAASVWFEPILTSLSGWPKECALKVFENADLGGPSRQYGNPAATAGETLNISLSQLTSGRLPERVLGFLDESQIETLLGRDIAADERVRALRKQLANAVVGQRAELAKRVYQASERSSKIDVQVLRQAFPELPLSAAEKLLRQARAAELQRISDENRLPLRIKTQARDIDFEAATARAYDGFYQPPRMTADTERLALNTLKYHTNSFGDLRIEVRNGTYDGELRGRAGPEDAALVRRLIRDEHGHYAVLDEANQPLYAAGDFYQAMLYALPDEALDTLGYRRGHGPLLKAWIMEKSAAPADRRSVLAEPPIAPVLPFATETLVRGPWLSKTATTPEQRVSKLYPSMSTHEVQAFVEALRSKGDPDLAITRLKDELDELRTLLENWRERLLPNSSGHDTPQSLADLHDFNRNGGQAIKEQLLECFERESEAFDKRSVHPEGGYTLDLSSEFGQLNLDRWWAKLRELPGIQKYLDQINVITLDRAHFSSGSNGLLNDLPNLRHVSARKCDLTELPHAIGRLRQLETLRLSDNHISLNSQAIEQLRHLTRLQTLRLDNNPLQRPPDVARMPRLRVLSLSNSGLSEWPPGLFYDAAGPKNRRRGFYLDLSGCPIDSLPEVIKGSDHAFIVARTRLDLSSLSDVDKVNFADYRRSVGLAAEQVYKKSTARELTYWTPAEDTGVFLAGAPGLGNYRAQSWQDVLAEPGSEGFFRLIRKQRESKDYRYAASRKLLTQRVWQMVEAAAQDSALREELFKQARAPESCGDAGSQLFNNMGMRVLVSQARAESLSFTERQARLVRLAKSAARLESIGDIARDQIKRQQSAFTRGQRRNPPDEVEVHLAYETGLAIRLDLPWQSQDMLYSDTADISQADIDSAYNKILGEEQGNGLIDRMNGLMEDPFWEQHLLESHPQRFAQNDQHIDEQLGLLEDLREAQKAWASFKEPTALAGHKANLERLARALNVPEREVFTGKPMSDELYNRLLDGITEARKALGRTLTRQAMADAGI